MEIDNYYLMSKQICDILSDNIKRYFEDNAKSFPLYPYYHELMVAWEAEARKNCNFDGVFNLNNFVWYILSTETQNSTVDNLRAKFFSLRRDRKRYYFKVIKDEFEHNKSGSLHDFCENYMKIQETRDANGQYVVQLRYSCFEDALRDHFERCQRWAKETDSDLMEYPFFSDLSDKRRATCFLYDVSFRIFDFIQKNYFSNAVDGYISQFPNFASKGIFGLKSSDVELAYAVTDHEVSSYSEHCISGKHGKTKIKDINEVVQGDFSTIVEGDSKTALVESMINNGQLSTEAKDFDSRDLAILGEVYSSFSIQDLTAGEKVMPLSQFVKAAYSSNKLRQSTYEQTIDHLDHMSRANINMITYDVDDNPVSMSTISFFELEYYLSDSSGSVNTKPIGGRESVTKKEFLETLKKQDMSKIYVKVKPSGTLRTTMKSQMNTKILSTLYNDIDQPKAKNLLVLLQQKRTDIYPKTEVILDYSFIVERLKLEGVRKVVYVKELRQLFGILKEKGFVKSFKLGTYDIVVDFTPISDEERELYNLLPGATASFA
jgi:hypothetical protein